METAKAALMPALAKVKAAAMALAALPAARKAMALLSSPAVKAKALAARAELLTLVQAVKAATRR